MTANKKTNSVLAKKWLLIVLAYVPLVVAFVWRAEYETITAGSNIFLQHGTNLIYSYGIVLSLLLYESRKQWASPRVQAITIGFMVLVNLVVELFVKVGDINLNTPIGTLSFEKFNTVIPDYGDLAFGIVGTLMAFVCFRFVIMPRGSRTKLT